MSSPATSPRPQTGGFEARRSILVKVLVAIGSGRSCRHATLDLGTITLGGDKELLYYT